MSDDEKEPEDKRSPILRVEDGGMPRGDDAKGLLKKFFDFEGDNFMGSGLGFREWSRVGDILQYHRWYATQTRDERKRRMKYIVAMSSEHERICAQDGFATFWSEACIEAAIAGNWDDVKMWAHGLKFEDEGAHIRNIAASKFAKFVEIAMEAWETRPRVFCPVCRKPTPQDFIGKHHDGRHICPWCQVVHDDAGEWVDKEKANLTTVDDPEPEEPGDE